MISLLFLIPFAVAFKSLLLDEKSSAIQYGTIAFLEIAVFIATLIIGLIYAWKKGIFDWNVEARAEAKAEAKALKFEKLKRVEKSKVAA